MKQVQQHTLTSDMTSDSFELQIIIQTAKDTTLIQREVSIGDYIQVESAMFMTMSMPG